MRETKWGLMVVLTLGCGPSGPEIVPIETAPVTGTATYEGRPLEDYRVFFYNGEHPAQEPATGRIDAEGRFTLSVREPNDGAMVGSNRIWFTYDPELPEEIPGNEMGLAPPPPKVDLPEQFRSSETSQLTVDVPAGGLVHYKIELP